MINFKSDNVVGVCPEIMEALAACNPGTESSYSADVYTGKVKKLFADIFETEVAVFLTTTGTASNVLALSALVKSYQAIYCHTDAHIHTDECGAYALFTGGATVSLVDGKEGKMNLLALQKAVDLAHSLAPHAQRPGCVSITQSTEQGTVYSIAELEAIADFSKTNGLPVHMDGARFTNALVSLGCTPADMTWKAGIDVLSFGATKNGAMIAEAVVFFNKQYAEHFEYVQKRAGQLVSKSRYLAAQFLGYFKSDLWIKNASHANTMAQQLAAIFRKHNVPLIYPVQANELFVILTSQIVTALRDKNVHFYEWGQPGSNCYRFVTSWATTQSEIEGFDSIFAEVVNGIAHNPNRKN